MDSELFVTIYKRYKAGTARFLAWLIPQANRWGGASNSSHNASFYNKFANSSRGAVKVPVDDLLRLSQLIAKSTKPKISVPIEVLRTLHDIIACRKRCFEKVVLKCHYPATENQLKSDEGHQHVITVLQEAFLALRSSTIEQNNYERIDSRLQNSYE